MGMVYITFPIQNKDLIIYYLNKQIKFTPYILPNPNPFYLLDFILHRHICALQSSFFSLQNRFHFNGFLRIHGLFFLFSHYSHLIILLFTTFLIWFLTFYSFFKCALIVQTCALRVDTQTSGWHKSLIKVLARIDGTLAFIYKLFFSFLFLLLCSLLYFCMKTLIICMNI